MYLEGELRALLVGGECNEAEGSRARLGCGTQGNPRGRLGGISLLSVELHSSIEENGSTSRTRVAAAQAATNLAANRRRTADARIIYEIGRAHV